MRPDESTRWPEPVDISQDQVDALATSAAEKLPADRAQELFDELDAHPTIVCYASTSRNRGRSMR